MVASVETRSEPATDELQLLTVGEVMAFLKISRTHAWRLINAGEIPSYQLGSSVRIPRQELLQSLKAKGSQKKSK